MDVIGDLVQVAHQAGLAWSDQLPVSAVAGMSAAALASGRLEAGLRHLIEQGLVQLPPPGVLWARLGVVPPARASVGCGPVDWPFNG